MMSNACRAAFKQRSPESFGRHHSFCLRVSASVSKTCFKPLVSSMILLSVPCSVSSPSFMVAEDRSVAMSVSSFLVTSFTCSSWSGSHGGSIKLIDESQQSHQGCDLCVLLVYSTDKDSKVLPCSFNSEHFSRSSCSWKRYRLFPLALNSLSGACSVNLQRL